LDPHSFLIADEAEGRAKLPHRWTVTSDTIAARVATAIEADILILLKSVSWPAGRDFDEASRLGVVDEYFPRELRRRPGLDVRIWDLRADND
jgi:aspartokinase-like uncharacterized kinase